MRSLVVSLCFLTAIAVSAQVPDLILVHGKILTVDAKDSIAEALAVSQGKIIAVGSDQSIQRMTGAGTRVIDLHGRTATPGLIDSHAHLAAGGVDELYSVSLGDATSVQQVLDRLSRAAAQLKPGEWLTGAGWDEGKLAERRYLLASDLDRVSPHNPVWLIHTTGHYGVANRMALRMAGITAATADPVAGTIDRDAHGEPTGVLKEAAMAAVTSLIPPPTPAQLQAGILRMVDVLHREGMTAIKDPDITQPTWDAYRALMEQNKLPLHVCVLWHGGTTVASAQAALARIQSLPQAPASLGDGNLLSCGVKLYMDGSGGARTAWLYDDWHQNSTGTVAGNHGYPSIDPEVYRKQVRLLHQAGVSVGTHAIGDRAIDWVVDTYALVEAEKPAVGLRHSVIHANIPTNHAIDTIAMLEKKYDAGYPESQPPFTWWIGDTYAGNFGPQRDLRLKPFHTYQERGILWAAGSDYPVTPLPARYGLWSAVERETANGSYGKHPFGTAEDIDVHTALRAYTAWAARQLFLENKIGSLEPGKDADIAIWDQDLYTMPSEQLRNLKCAMTFYHGNLVYEASPTGR